ncbi:hypothetical protein TWF281_006613 [Arthrobotrys megalospora]
MMLSSYLYLILAAASMASAGGVYVRQAVSATTVTVTATVTTTPAASCASPIFFRLQQYSPPTPSKINWVAIQGTATQVAVLTTKKASAAIFMLDANGYVYYGSTILGVRAFPNSAALQLTSVYDGSADPPIEPLVCDVSETGLAFTCKRLDRPNPERVPVFGVTNDPANSTIWWGDPKSISFQIKLRAEYA